MGRNLLDLISAKIELFRLEQRYTKRRHRRSTFVSEAQYVDGEYIYASSPAPSPTSPSYSYSYSYSYNSSGNSKRHSTIVTSHFPHSTSSAESVSSGSGPESPSRSNMPGYGHTPAARAEMEDASGGHEREGRFGSAGELATTPGEAGRRTSRWGAAGRAIAKRRSMVTVQEVRWEDHQSPERPQRGY